MAYTYSKNGITYMYIALMTSQINAKIYYYNLF
jgi:hypothetical protein